MINRFKYQSGFFAMLLILPLWASSQNLQFKLDQLKNENVKTAYVDKENDLKKLVIKKGFRSFSNHVALRYYKHEQVLEVWIKPPSSVSYTLFKRYKTCGDAGDSGPKKLLGDYTIPEGIYSLDMFVPDSPNFLALSINYPNTADINRKSQKDVVSITGGCDSKGNINLEEESMKEIYVMTVEAKASGQEEIPVHIFPAVLLDDNLAKLQSLYPEDEYNHDLWASLKVAFNYFNKTKRIPIVQATDNGLYVVQTSTGSLLWNPEKDHLDPQVLTASIEKLPEGVTARGVVKQESFSIASAIKSAEGRSLHKVSAGETLFSLSRKYNISLDEIRNWNGIAGNNLIVGQEITVSAPSYYTVQKGDTMYSIAKRNSLTVQELQGLNNMSDFAIKIGDKLIVRKG